MKKLILSLMLAIAGMAHAGYTSLEGGLIVGRDANSDALYLTKTGYVYLPLSIHNVTLNNGYTVATAVSNATDAYMGPVTGVTNSACVTLPAVTGAGGAINFVVPYNYRSGGVFQVMTHVHTTITLGQLSLTADVYAGSTDAGVTSVAKTAGTPVQVPVNALTVPQWITLTNAHTYAPGSTIQVKILPTGTTARTEILAIRFKFRPFGVLNGTQSMNPYWVEKNGLLAILKRFSPILNQG